MQQLSSVVCCVETYSEANVDQRERVSWGAGKGGVFNILAFKFCKLYCRILQAF